LARASRNWTTPSIASRSRPKRLGDRRQHENDAFSRRACMNRFQRVIQILDEAIGGSNVNIGATERFGGN
jgi:hypothetical protein